MTAAIIVFCIPVLTIEYRCQVYLFRYDSDNPRVEGDVGMAGVAIDSVEDMKVCVTEIRY